MAYESLATVTPAAPAPPSTIDGHTITRNPDGTITIEGPAVLRARVPQLGEFDENLAETMDIGERRKLAMLLKEYADVDRESRKDWESREQTCLVMLGIKDRIEKDADEEQGHDVTHPVLMDATCRFQANAITELFPPTGPADTKISGLETPKKTAQAKRMRQFLNHYLTVIDDGYFNDTDKMLMYVPMGGSVFRKASQDYTTGLPSLRHVKGTNFIAPYSGTDLKTMPRYAHAFTMSGEDIDKSQEIGIFADIYLPQPPIGQAEHPKADDVSDMREPILHERDRLYSILEYHIDLRLDFDPLGAGAEDLGEADTGTRPYIAVVDVDNNEVLMLRRNWREKDQSRRKRIWFTHHQFLPGLGFYGWGYPHVIGSLGLAASGAVNSLLDSALAANFQGGFYTKEGRERGEMRLEHGVWKSVDATAEDLAKSFYTPPFKEPSPALFQLLGALVDAGQRFAGTTDAAVGDGSNMGPVGTTVALIDQASKPQTAIHKRLHVSFAQELKMLCDLIEDFMPDRYDYELGDSQEYLLRSDFAPGVEVVPVSDPNVSSDTQRIMRAQAVLDMQKEAPDLYPPPKRIEAHRRMLVALKTPNLDAVAPVAQQPQYLDPVGENGLMLKGMPVQVFPQQNDQAHVAIHQDFLARAQNMVAPKVFEVLAQHVTAHIQDHLSSMYRKQMYAAAGVPPKTGPDGNPMPLDPQTEQQITVRILQVIHRLPHPEPKPGTPNADAAMADAKVQAFTAMEGQKRDQQQQSFDAEENRKQTAFDNEERRKDQALANQEARIDTTAAGDIVRTQHHHGQDLRHTEQSHTQDIVHDEASHQQDRAHADDAHEQQLTHSEISHGQDLAHGAETAADKREQGAAAHEQRLEQGAASHEQQLDQGAASHEQRLDQTETIHQQGMQHADQLAKAAASEEAEADSHTGLD